MCNKLTSCNSDFESVTSVELDLCEVGCGIGGYKVNDWVLRIILDAEM